MPRGALLARAGPAAGGSGRVRRVRPGGGWETDWRGCWCGYEALLSSGAEQSWEWDFLPRRGVCPENASYIYTRQRWRGGWASWASWACWDASHLNGLGILSSSINRLLSLGTLGIGSTIPPAHVPNFSYYLILSSTHRPFQVQSKQYRLQRYY